MSDFLVEAMRGTKAKYTRKDTAYWYYLGAIVGRVGALEHHKAILNELEESDIEHARKIGMFVKVIGEKLK